MFQEMNLTGSLSLGEIAPEVYSFSSLLKFQKMVNFTFNTILNDNKIITIILCTLFFLLLLYFIIIEPLHLHL